MDLYLDLANALAAQQHGRWTHGADGRKAVLAPCLFHSDSTPSAYFYPDDGWYYCFACDRSYQVERVADELGFALQQKRPQHIARASATGLIPNEVDHHHIALGLPSAVYPYVYPDGRISHYRLRFESGGRKDFRTQAADGQWRRPDPYWPIYQAHDFLTGWNLIICEGEKACDFINRRQEVYQGMPIWAITLGSAADFQVQQDRKLLISRLEELRPARVLVWPDNDRAAKEWAPPLFKAIQVTGIQCRLVEPRGLLLQPKNGPDDYCMDGRQLASVYEREFRQVGGQTLEDLVRDTIVTRNGQFMLPGTRTLYTINQENARFLWYRMTGEQVPYKTLTVFQDSLRNKVADAPHEIAWRRWYDSKRTQLVWRPRVQGDAYRVNKDGVTITEDPPGAVILLPQGEQRFTSDVAPGTRADLELLLSRFGLDDQQIKFIEAWLICALVGLETPILLLKAEAGAGKTTLARILLGLIEPTCPAIQLPSNVHSQTDNRALVNGLRQNVGAILDNISTFSADAEDVLCQCVTGYSVVYRTLHTENMETLSLQRAIIITTTKWEVHKGDLSTRLLPIRLASRTGGYMAQAAIEAEVMPIMERVRGYLFQLIALYYLNVAKTAHHSAFRTAGLGDVLEALGYQTEAMSERLFGDRSSMATETDFWFETICEMWDEWVDDQEIHVNDFFETDLAQICDRLARAELRSTQESSPRRVANWLKEHNPLFQDYGFSIEQARTSQRRYWIMRCVRDRRRPDA